MMTPDKAWDFEALGWDGKQLPELAKEWLYHAVYTGPIMGLYYIILYYIILYYIILYYIILYYIL